jgi:hypothetical protein
MWEMVLKSLLLSPLVGKKDGERLKSEENLWRYI